MLMIRDEQMKALADRRRRGFEDAMADYVRAKFFPAQYAASDESSRAFVRESVRLGKAFGIEQAYDLRRFIEFRAEYGENFHRLEWAAPILNDATLSPCGKMERIDDYSLYVLR